MDLWGTLKRGVSAATNAAQTVMGLKAPHEEFQYLATQTVAWIDREAELPQSDGEAGLLALKRSKVKENVTRIVELLKADAKQVRTMSALLSATSSPSARSARPAPSATSAGLVIDALLQTRFVEQLCRRAIRDRPVGTMPLLLQCVACIVEDVQYPLLPHVSIRNALADLLPRAVSYSTQYKSQLPPPALSQTCEQVQKSLVMLLRAIWLQLAVDPNQIDFFFHAKCEGDSSIVKQLFAQEGISENAEAETDVGDYLQAEEAVIRVSPGKSHLKAQSPGVTGAHVDILTPLVNAALQDTESGSHARDALLVALSLKETLVCDFLVSQTNFVPNLADAMAAAYCALPKALGAQRIKPTGFLSTLVQFANSMTQLSSEMTVVERTASPRRMPVRGEVAVRDFASFVVATTLDRFVHPVLVPALTEPSEDQALTACRYVSAILQSMVSVSRRTPLLEAFAQVILLDGSHNVRDKIIGAMNSPSARVATGACTLLAKAIGVASTGTVVQAMLSVEPYEAVAVEPTSEHLAQAEFGDQEAFRSKFDRVNFTSDEVPKLENTALRALVRQCASHTARPIVGTSGKFGPSPLLNALLVRSKAFANISSDAQGALVVLYSRLLTHVCAAQMLPSAAGSERAAIDTLLTLLYGTAYARHHNARVAPNMTTATDIASKVWQDVHTHVTNIPAWEEKLDLVWRAWHAGLTTLDAETTIEPAAQTILFTHCMLEEWILELHAYLVACDLLNSEAILLEELRMQNDLGYSPARDFREHALDSSECASVADSASIVGDDDMLESSEVGNDFRISDSAVDAEVSHILATLDELVRENPGSSLN